MTRPNHGGCKLLNKTIVLGEPAHVTCYFSRDKDAPNIHVENIVTSYNIKGCLRYHLKTFCLSTNIIFLAIDGFTDDTKLMKIVKKFDHRYYNQFGPSVKFWVSSYQKCSKGNIQDCIKPRIFHSVFILF